MYLFQEGTKNLFKLRGSRTRYTIGRGPQCDIKIQSKFISRKHCEIVLKPPNNPPIIKNLAKSNGTYVGSNVHLTDVQEACVLEEGVLIGLGLPLKYADQKGGSKKKPFVFLRLFNSKVTAKEHLEKLRKNRSPEIFTNKIHTKNTEPDKTHTCHSLRPKETHN